MKTLETKKKVLTKNDLAWFFYVKYEITKEQSKKMADELINDFFIQNIKNGKEIQIVGLGRFYSIRNKRYQNQFANPKNYIPVKPDAKYKAKAEKTIKFKASINFNRHFRKKENVDNNVKA